MSGWTLRSPHSSHSSHSLRSLLLAAGAVKQHTAWLLPRHQRSNNDFDDDDYVNSNDNNDDDNFDSNNEDNDDTR